MSIHIDGVNLTDYEKKAVIILDDILGKIKDYDIEYCIETRSSAYKSLTVFGDDFLRFKISDRTAWVSIAMQPNIYKSSTDERFLVVENKNQLHWKFPLISTESLRSLEDIIIRSAASSFSRATSNEPDLSFLEESPQKSLPSENTVKSSSSSLFSFPNNCVIIDVETTGLSPTLCEIIELAAVKINNNEIVDTFTSLVKPKGDIPEYIQILTGIEKNMLASAPQIEDILPSFLDFIGTEIVVGHNVIFDIKFIQENCQKILGYAFENDYIDTLRLSKKLVKICENYKLETLVKYFNISQSDFHRALADCQSTYELFSNLRMLNEDADKDFKQRFSNVDGILDNKIIVFKGSLSLGSFDTYFSICEKAGGKATQTLTQQANYVVLGKYMYSNYQRGNYSEKLLKIIKLQEDGKLKILSEKQFVSLLGVTLQLSASEQSKSNINIKSMSPQVSDFDESHPLYGKLCVFTGTLDKMPRRDAMQAVLNAGGEIGDSVTKKTNFLILGCNEFCPLIKDGKSNKQKKAEEYKLKGFDIEIIDENIFYSMLDE